MASPYDAVMHDAPGTKGDLRRHLRARRREIIASRDLAADAAVMAAALPPLAAPATVLSYESLPHEPPTAALNEALLEAGHRVLVPITLADLRLQWCDLADPRRSELGLDAPEGADLALIPALAVDTTGTRLGQGGGCYDRVLPMLTADSPVIALLHPGEHTSVLLPRDRHDIPVPSVLSALGLSGADKITRG